MRTYKVGVIRVLTTNDWASINYHGKLLEQYYPMFSVESRCIPDQGEGIHDAATLSKGAPKVVTLAKQMWKEGFEAIIVSCAEDPGVEEARKILPIPIIGAGESTAALAMFFGNRPAALGITAELPKVFERFFGDRLVDSTRGKGVTSTLDLATSAGYAATVDAARKQKDMGANVIALSCTGMSTIGIASNLEHELGIPVLDPIMCAGLMTLFALIRNDTMRGDTQTCC